MLLFQYDILNIDIVSFQHSGNPNHKFGHPCFQHRNDYSTKRKLAKHIYMEKIDQTPNKVQRCFIDSKISLSNTFFLHFLCFLFVLIIICDMFHAKNIIIAHIAKASVSHNHDNKFITINDKGYCIYLIDSFFCPFLPLLQNKV